MSQAAPSEAVVVTGIAALTPFGDQISELTDALCAGRDVIQTAAEPDQVGEARLRDFDATRYANVRGMRVYPRTTQLAICAAKCALDAAGLTPDQLAPEALGVVMASTFAHLETLLAYDEGLVTVGIQRTNPTLMPLGIPSAAGAAVALALGAKAFSITLSDGGASSLAALGLGARMIADKRARACIVVGAASICREFMASATDSRLTATAECFRVLDEQSCGLVFGEAAAALVLESASHARQRGAELKAVVRGFASTFAAEPRHAAHALERACALALRRARVDAEQLALVSSGANGVPEHDVAEAHALLGALGSLAARVPIIAVKASLGEVFDVSGLLQTIVAISSLQARTAPGIARLQRPSVAGLRCLAEPSLLSGEHALVTARSFSGACSALVLEQAS